MSRNALFFGFRIQIERLFAPLFVLPGGAPGCESYSKTIDLAVPVLSAGFRPKRVDCGLWDAPASGRLASVLCTAFDVTSSQGGNVLP